MTLINMKISTSDIPEPVSEDTYGYGLQITLTREQSKRLGFDKNPPEVGSEVGIQAAAVVIRVTQEVEAPDGDQENPDVDSRVSMQITDISVSKAVTPPDTSKLYGGD